MFKSISRVHSNCVKDNSCVEKSNGNVSAFKTFERLLMVAGEHTWGWNGGDTTSKSWSSVDLQQSLKSDSQFQDAVLGWLEQRSFLYNAVASLPANSVLAEKALEAIQAVKTNLQKGEVVNKGNNHGDVIGRDFYSNIKCGDFIVGIDARDGSINKLVNYVDGKQYADSNNTLAKIYYQGMDKNYFKRYVDDYIAGISDIWPTLTAEGFYKPGLNLPPISSFTKVVDVSTDNSTNILIDLQIKNRLAHTERGAPDSFQANITCNANSIGYQLLWFNKTSTHVPETIWMLNNPLQLKDLAGQLPSNAV